MSGSGVDFSYDEARDLIGISDQSNVKLAGDKSGAGATNVTAGSSVLARKDNFVSFERAVHITRGTQVIDAESAVGELTDKEERLRSLDLQTAARIETPAAAPGELRAMSGDVINLTYQENSDLVESVSIAGGSALRIAGEKDTPDRILHADTLEIGMAPDGTTVTSLNGRDHVVLDLPGVKDQPAKKVSSNVLVATGTPKAGLTDASFTDRVEYSETGGTPPVKRTVKSRTLDTALNGGLGEIQRSDVCRCGAVRRPEHGGRCGPHALQHADRTGGAQGRARAGRSAGRERADAGRCERDRDEHRRLEAESDEHVEARPVDHVSGQARIEEHAPHAGPDEAGSAREWSQPRAALHGR